MKKKDKMKRLGILLLALTAITVIITFVIVMNLSDPTDQKGQPQEQFDDSYSGWIRNVYIMSNKDNEIIILYDKTNYIAKGTAQNDYTGVADIELSHGKITRILAKPDGIEGILDRYSETEVQIKDYEALSYDDTLPVYVVADSPNVRQPVHQIAMSDLVIGNSKVKLIVADEKACAVVQYSKDIANNIRVLLKNGNNITYSDLYIKSNKTYTVNEKKVKAKKLTKVSSYLKGKKNGEEICISPATGKLFICNRKGKKLAEAYEGNFIVRKETGGYVLINELSVEDYVRYVLPSEMPLGFSYEALKAQAVCARTFAYGQMHNQAYAQYGANLDNTTAYQVYHATTTYDVTDQAVQDTSGMVLTYDGALTDCYYYSTSPGYSETLEVWNADSPGYLKGENHTQAKTKDLSNKQAFHKLINKQVKSYDSDSPYYRWTATISNKMGMDPELGRLKKIKVKERSSSGYVLSLTASFELGDRDYDAENDIRFFLGKYMTKLKLADGTVRTDASSVPSACFEVKSQKNGKIVLSGGGFGHGIGMSQYGANAMGEEGMSWQEILQFYYHDVKIENIFDVDLEQEK